MSEPNDDGAGGGHAAVRRRIAATERDAGRPPGSLELIAVGRTFQADAQRGSASRG